MLRLWTTNWQNTVHKRGAPRLSLYGHFESSILQEVSYHYYITVFLSIFTSFLLLCSELFKNLFRKMYSFILASGSHPMGWRLHFILILGSAAFEQLVVVSFWVWEIPKQRIKKKLLRSCNGGCICKKKHYILIYH